MTNTECRDRYSGLLNHIWGRWVFMQYIEGVFAIKAVQSRECGRCGLTEWRKDRVV